MQKFTWHMTLWAVPNIPKHAFIAWMTILDKLPTADRLQSWGFIC